MDTLSAIDRADFFRFLRRQVVPHGNRVRWCLAQGEKYFVSLHDASGVHPSSNRHVSVPLPSCSGDNSEWPALMADVDQSEGGAPNLVVVENSLREYLRDKVQEICSRQVV